MDNRLRPFTVFAVIITALVLCGGFFYVGYSFNQYQSKLDQNNYNFTLGRTAGEKIGREVGFQEGYTAGLSDAKASKGVFTTHDPTYKEMKDFLAADKSDQSKYVEDLHNCTDYTTEVNNNAESKGIRCASVYIIYGETGHSIVGFNTRDKGLVFIEPQYDKEVKLTIGKGYARENGFVKPDDLDDTILRYLIMW